MARWTKGMQSPNPAGRSIAKARMAPGYDGQVAFSGYLQTGEDDSDLRGTQRWKTFANMYRRPPVAIWARLRSSLLGGITWTAVENPSGGAAATRGMEIVDQGMLKARFGSGAAARPWSAVAARAMNGAAAVGFSIHATALGRRKDGLVVFADIAHRPQNTIERWMREYEDELSPFAIAEQRTARGKMIPLYLDECLYVVNDNGTNSDSPAGVGMLSLIAEDVRRLGVYEPLEGTEMVSSLGGIPVTRAPIEEMKSVLRKELAKDSSAASKITAVITEKLTPLREFVAKRFAKPSLLRWFELDSATYETTDGNPTTVKKWDIEIIKGEERDGSHIRKVITDLHLGIARMLGVEHVFTGGDSRGSYGQHDSQVSALGATLNAEVGLFSFVSAQQLARRLVRANGLDPDEATPTLIPSPIMRADIAKAVDAIVRLNMAGLPTNHPAKKAVFEGVDLPWQDEEEPMLPRLPMPGRTQPQDPEDDPEDPGEDPTEDPRSEDA